MRQRLPEAPDPDADLVHRVAMLFPSYAEEYAALQADIISLTGAPLSPRDKSLLVDLTSARVAAMAELRQAEAECQAASLAQSYWRRELSYLELMERGAVVEEWSDEEPSLLGLMWEQAKHNLDPRPLLRNVKQYVIESGRRAERYRREAVARGDYVAAAFTQSYAVGEMTFETISDGLRLARRRLGDALTARTRAEAAIAGLESVLGLGQAGLAAYSVAAPLSEGLSAAPFGSGGPNALATAGTGSSATTLVAGAEAATAASLSRPAIVMAIIGSDSGGGRRLPGSSGTESPALKESPYHPDKVAERRTQAQKYYDGADASGRRVPLSRKEARELAQQLGYKEVQDPPFMSHGQPAFQRGSRFITPDRDLHRGGSWKVFDRRGNRLGTYNDDLTRKVGP